MITFIFEIFLSVAIIAILWLVVSLSLKHPSNDRDWSPDNEIPSTVEWKSDGKILIKNIRHASYKTATDYVVTRYDCEYDLNKLKKVWLFLVHFTGYKFAAHTFVSFEFEDGAFVCVSVEVRKKRDEKWSAVKGFLRHFELMYVIADERDVVRLRTDHHKDNVFLYPLKLSKEKAQELFCNMLKRANALAETPEFYHTARNACFGNIVNHINNVIPKKLPFDYRITLPENADEYMYDFDLIDTDLPFSSLRKKHLINPLVEKYADNPEFSLRIRGQ